MRNIQVLLLLAIFMCAGTSALTATPESNCMAIILNGMVFQPGTEVVVRVVPGVCAPADIRMELSIQLAEKFSQTWTEVAKRKMRLRGLASDVAVEATRIVIPPGESEYRRGLYRILVSARPADPAYPAALFSYRETPMFYIGESGLNPNLGGAFPEERMYMSYITPAVTEVHKDNRLRFTGRLGAGGKAIGLFYQFREDGELVTHRSNLQQEDSGTAVRAPGGSVAFPNTFSADGAVWVHLMDPSTGVSTNDLFYDPTNPMRTMPWGFAGPPSR